MQKHFDNMKFLYGNDVHVQIPNDIFKELSTHIKNRNGSTNIQQSSFAYSYIVIIAILYKYAHFVDIDNETYMQNADIKELLGYSRTTKSIDAIIKKGGVLDEIGLTTTTKDYPISFDYHATEKINNVAIRQFTTVSELGTGNTLLDSIKRIVKNRNYEIKEPKFSFEYNGFNGTLYDYSNTHKVTLEEVLTFIREENLDNIDFSIYCFLKSKCKGYESDSKAIGLHKIISNLGISKDAFYSHLDKLKLMGFVEVTHKGWVMGANKELEANTYHFKGVGK